MDFVLAVDEPEPERASELLQPQRDELGLGRSFSSFLRRSSNERDFHRLRVVSCGEAVRVPGTGSHIVEIHSDADIHGRIVGELYDNALA